MNNDPTRSCMSSMFTMLASSLFTTLAPCRKDYKKGEKERGKCMGGNRIEERERDDDDDDVTVPI